MKKNKFTTKQIRDFAAYKKVQMGGRYNMFDPRARQLTGLTEKEYVFVMDNYDELEEISEK